MVAARPVSVAVLKFFGSGVANVNHLDFKVERLARQLVVAVDAHCALLHVHHAEHPRSLGRVGLELHSHIDLAGVFKTVAGNVLNERGIVLAKAFLRRNGDRQLIALGFAFQRRFQPRNNIARPMQVGQRIALFRRIEHIARIIRKAVGEREPWQAALPQLFCSSGWMLLDFGDLVVHVFHSEERVYYGLERLWKDCPVVPIELPAPAAGE